MGCFTDKIITERTSSNSILTVLFIFLNKILDGGVGCQKYNDDVIKWKHFPRYWHFVRGINRSPMNSPHKGQWRGALVFSLICTWLNGWVNNHEAGELGCHRTHNDVTLIRFLHIRLFVWKYILDNRRLLDTRDILYWQRLSKLLLCLYMCM